MDSDLQTLTQALRDFARERHWEPFHSPKNLAAALSVEAASEPPGATHDDAPRNAPFSLCENPQTLDTWPKITKSGRRSIAETCCAQVRCF